MNETTVNAASTVSLSLVSHTNVGKTTLARTLLLRDIGEVRDEAHVTERAESQLWIESPAGDRLLLWDTPGFGDSLRLAKRLAQAGNLLGWFMTEVWDRWRDRPFWATQRALRHVMDESDVVLYLVNAGEAPEDAGYLDAELQVLGLIGKPVVALLNQLGPLGTLPDAGAAVTPAGADASLEQRWQQRLQTSPTVHAVLPLDAFSRCWVQEGVLWRTLVEATPAGKREALLRLQAAWQARQLGIWRSAVTEIARRLARSASDVQPIEGTGGALQRIGQGLGRTLGLRSEAATSARERAMAALADRLDSDFRASMSRLIALHGLDGRAGGEVLAKLARHYAEREPLDEGRAALWGGAVSGALVGLKADLASGGLTLGGGLLAGGVIGALAAAGAARGVNQVRGLEQPQLAWDARVLDALLASALLGYLAIAHHGRGRGEWVDEAPPGLWTAAVGEAMATRRQEIDALWAQRAGGVAVGNALPAGASAGSAALQARLERLLADSTADLLVRLYPQSGIDMRF